ncbi:MAG: transcriptional regulator NanR [Lentisphaerae bacterium ADurb.Bin242]|nr:MAG: transcriptional regulator NanR [Lentisphaerae bacterium ADurb.Bin242]
MGITRIQKKTTAEAAIEAIRNHILANRLSEGDVLPRENEFAAALGISRNILREAMRHYRTLGIIATRPKTGAVILRLVPENPYEAYFPFLAAEKNTLEELAHFRACIESGAARQIAETAQSREIEELRRIAEAMKTAAEMEEQLALEIQFHTLLLRIPGNSLLSGMAPLIVGFFAKMRRKHSEPSLKKSPGEIAAEHERIVDALRKKDAGKLYELLYEHNRSYFSGLRNSRKEEKKK